MPVEPTTRRPLVIAAIMTSMFMVAIEATIVATAMPLIVGQLGGLNLYSWVFSSFLLTQTATSVVFGKLSDLYGRKPILLAGIAVFLAGSILCGFAWSMLSMVIFRLIQGVGAGALQPVAMTVVGDLYPARERGKIQGYLASVWAISAVIGPLAGGLIVQHVHWAWIFWMNVPIGLLAAAGFISFLHETVVSRRLPIDILGALLFTLAVAALMISLTELATQPQAAIGAALVCVVSALLFFLQERRAPDPLISMRVWGHRPIAAANGASLLAGMTLIGLTTFLPMYVQGVMNRSPLVAGFALTTMVFGWPIGATLAARNLHRFGLRTILVFGSALMPVGALGLLVLPLTQSATIAGLGSLLMGFGMGLLSTASLVLIQDIVAWQQRGGATASNLFSRNLGSTIGAALLGSVLNYGLSRSGSAITSEQLRQLLETAGGHGLADSTVRDALQGALMMTFWTVFAISLSTVLVAWLVPVIKLGHQREAQTLEGAGE
jgi:EmrB/QacA subfamily drug resistance transporter